MNDQKFHDVIIIGGSYSGLAAGMALGRALRDVLIIDSGKPCNAQTPHSHNFITHDGKTPSEISKLAKDQVSAYNNVKFHNGLAIEGSTLKNGFQITTEKGDSFNAKKLIFATGVKDVMPDIKGFAECWGISILHCPYCHGYEVRNETTGIFGNGDYGYEFAKLISNWTKKLSLYTNGKSTLTEEQKVKLQKHNIPVVETEIDRFEQEHGKVKSILFKDRTSALLSALYARPAFQQHCDIPKQLGCELTEMGYLQIDPFQKTNISGVYACGDNASFMRSLANAVAMGTLTGAMVNKELIEDHFLTFEIENLFS